MKTSIMLNIILGVVSITFMGFYIHSAMNNVTLHKEKRQLKSEVLCHRNLLWDMDERVKLKKKFHINKNLVIERWVRLCGYCGSLSRASYEYGMWQIKCMKKNCMNKNSIRCARLDGAIEDWNRANTGEPKE